MSEESTNKETKHSEDSASNRRPWLTYSEMQEQVRKTVAYFEKRWEEENKKKMS